MTVEFREMAGSPVETYDADGLTASRALLCAWDDREQLVELLLGDGYEYGGLSRAQYPGKSDIVAVRARCEPFTDDVTGQTLTDLTEGLNRYGGFAKVTVNYELLTPSDRVDVPEVADGTFLTYRQDYKSEEVPLSADSLSWEDKPAESVPSAAVPTIRMVLVEHHLTWHRVVNPPWQAIRRCVGTVNDNTFLAAAASTVLCDGATARREFIRFSGLARAEFAWRIDFVFLEKAVKTGNGQIVGWNHAYRSLPTNDPGWDRLADAAGNRPYRSADFSELFQFEATTGA